MSPSRHALWVLCVMLLFADLAAPALIDFDFDPDGNPIVAPSLFIEATALRDLYAPLGVLFRGPGLRDGGAILDQDSNFGGVSAVSGRNFLAFNPTDLFLADGGRPYGPETILFTLPVTHVSMFVYWGSPFTLEAYDADDSLVASLTIPVTTEFTPVSVSSHLGISRLVLAGGSLSFLIDDLEFWAVPEPNATSILLAGVVLTFQFRRRSSLDRRIP